MSACQRPCLLVVLFSFFLFAATRSSAQCSGSGPYTCTVTQSVSIPAGPYGTGVGTWVPASVYPSTLTVSGLSGTVGGISVQLHGLTSDAAGLGCGTADLGVLLKAPNGSYMELMGLAGNCTANSPEDWGSGGVTLTIQDGLTPTNREATMKAPSRPPLVHSATTTILIRRRGREHSILKQRPHRSARPR